MVLVFDGIDFRFTFSGRFSLGISRDFRRVFSCDFFDRVGVFRTWKYSLVEIDKWMEMKYDRNGLLALHIRWSAYPSCYFRQQGHYFLGVLLDHVQQGQRFGQFTIQPTVKFPDGCTLLKGFT